MTEEVPQKFKVGQVVMMKGKREVPFRIIGVLFESGMWFYQWNRNNFAAENLIRALTVEEKGE